MSVHKLPTTNVLGMHSFCVIPYHMFFTQNRFGDSHFLHIKCSIHLSLVFFGICRLFAILLCAYHSLSSSFDNTLQATSQISQISSVARFFIATSELGLVCTHRYCSLINNYRFCPLTNKYIDDGASNSISRWDDTLEDFSCSSKKLGGAFFHSPFSRESDLTFRMLTVELRQYCCIVLV